MNAQERIYLTADKTAVVGFGDKRAAFLYAAIGDEIPDSAAKMFGIVDGKLKGKGSAKADEPATGDDLSKIKGIGAASAKALVAAGIDSFAALAAIDPASPPAFEGLSSRVDWAAWVDGAKERSKPAEDKENKQGDDKDGTAGENKGG